MCLGSSSASIGKISDAEHARYLRGEYGDASRRRDFRRGGTFHDRTTNNLAKYCSDATVLHIDIDPASISKAVTADVPIVGNARHVIEQMLELLEHGENRQPLDSLRDWWRDIKQ